MSSSYPGANTNDIVLQGAQTLALTLYNDAKSEINIKNSSSPFQFTIPFNQAIPSFAAINLKQISNNLLKLDAFNLTKKNVTIQYHIKPANNTLTDTLYAELVWSRLSKLVKFELFWMQKYANSFVFNSFKPTPTIPW